MCGPGGADDQTVRAGGIDDGEGRNVVSQPTAGWRELTASGRLVQFIILCLGV